MIRSKQRGRSCRLRRKRSCHKDHQDWRRRVVPRRKIEKKANIDDEFRERSRNSRENAVKRNLKSEGSD